MKRKKLSTLFLVFALIWFSQMLAAQSSIYDDSDGPFTILAQAVTVLSPNGGENWAVASSRNITWSSSSTIANVNIDYSTDSGSSWTLVAANIANSGTHAWTVPNTPSTTCLMRVRDAANAGTYDVSDAVFSISTVPTLTISGTITTGGTGLANVVMNGLPGNPTTNASGFYSATVDYNWSGTATPILAGYTFSPENKTYTNVVANQTAQDYTATAVTTLTISGTITSGGTGLVNVVMNGLPGNPTTNASGFYTASINYGWSGTVTPTMANYTFTPPSTTYTNVTTSQTTNYAAASNKALVITAPNSTSIWAPGATCTITWLKQGTQDANVKIYLYQGISTLIKTITKKTNNDGSYDWRIPRNLQPGSEYFIRVQTVDNLISDDSDKFSIIVPSITITAPVTGSAWQRGIMHTITWNKEGLMNADVKIELLNKNKVVLTIATSTANNGSFDWTIPATQTLASTYKIRITTVDNLVKGDSGIFTISNISGLVLLAPNGDGILKPAVRQLIRWQGDPSVLEVKLEFSRNNGSTFSTIADHVPNTGRYEWLVPVNFTRNAIIRVSDSNGKLWQDKAFLEYSFRFSYSPENDYQQPAAVFWFGSSDPESPSYGFARITLAHDVIQFSDFSKSIEPLSGAWHELRVRFDFHHDTATLYLDKQPLFENLSLFTSHNHYFEPYLVLQSGADVPIDFRFDDLQINIVQLDDEGNDQKLFTVLADPFERYNEKVNGIQNCWRMKNPKVKESTVAVEAENNSNKVLRLNSVAGKSILLYLPINIPARIPFDISDQCFTIENQ